MKRQIKKWAFRLIITVVFIIGLLLVIVLNPTLTYANKTVHNNFTIYHTTNLDPLVIEYLDQARELLKTSEFYTTELKLDICLNDGAKYPNIIKAIRGEAFAFGFYNKVVLQGSLNCKENNLELNGYKWNVTQLLAHEMVHCLQYKKLGLLKSNPIASIPNWKWEGYAEYIARKNSTQTNLKKNVQLLESTASNAWAVHFEDSTIAPKEYYKAWNLVQYCMEIKAMTYQQILDDTTSEIEITNEMKNWYFKNVKNN